MRPSLITRLRTWRDRAVLDQMLASGIDASHTPELSLRARQLTEPGALHGAAAALEAVVERAEACGEVPRPPAPLKTRAVLHARAGLLGLALRLKDDEVVEVRAAAMTNTLLGSGSGPLYTDPTGDSIWELARRASSAIDAGRRLHDVAPASGAVAA